MDFKVNTSKKSTGRKPVKKIRREGIMKNLMKKEI